MWVQLEGQTIDLTEISIKQQINTAIEQLIDKFYVELHKYIQVPTILRGENVKKVNVV